MEKLTLTVAFEPVEGGWVQARIVEIPGVITVGHDRAEARESIMDALREYLLAAGEEAPSSFRSIGESERLTLEIVKTA